MSDFNEMLGQLSNEDIDGYLKTYKDMPAIVKTLEGIKEARLKNAELAKAAMEAEVTKVRAESEFMDSVSKLVAKVKSPPSTVLNILLSWTKTIVKSEEEGQPDVERWGWAYKVNHVCQSTTASKSGGTTESNAAKKLEVTAYKLVTDPTDAAKKIRQELGKYPSMRAACNANNVTATKASARQDAAANNIYFD